jgi:hypothetical protein
MDQVLDVGVGRMGGLMANRLRCGPLRRVRYEREAVKRWRRGGQSGLVRKEVGFVGGYRF